MNILVTGGAGFIGSHVCENLLKLRHKVICIDDFNDYYEPKIKEKNIKDCLKNKNFKIYRIDVRNFDDLKNIFQKNKIDKIVHLAARAGVRASIANPELYEKVNVKGTLNLLELAKQYKIKEFIFGSSSSIYGVNKKIPFSEEDKTDNPISPYAATKRAAELLCYKYHKTYGLNVTCLRFFTVYGPRGRPDMAIYKFTKLISQGKPIEIYGTKKSKRDYTYVSDIVKGILSALNKNFKFEIINLGDSNPVQLDYLISLIEKNLGKKAKIIKKSVQKGDVPITFADISKAKKLLDYSPEIKIEQGIKKFVEWFKNENIAA